MFEIINFDKFFEKIKNTIERKWTKMDKNGQNLTKMGKI